MTGSLLCGVDEAPGSLAAARVAADLAERLEVGLVLVHVAPVLVIPGARSVPNAQQELRALAREEAERVLAQIADDAGCDGAELRAELGDPARKLIALADEYDASLLVVGTGGRGPVREMLLGSVSHTLCRQARCPVVVVPPGAASAVVDARTFLQAQSSR